jgi:hypothetical protein
VVYYRVEGNNTEEFGDSTEFLIGSSDLPLQPGVRKQARMRSSVGFVYNSVLSANISSGRGPAVRYELYAKASFGDSWNLVYTGDVDKRMSF